VGIIAVDLDVSHIDRKLKLSLMRDGVEERRRSDEPRLFIRRDGFV
jgi:hypothetical protein